MANTIRIALSQINPRVGDFDYNARLILESAEAAALAGAQLVVYPELVLTGYPPEDLLLRPEFLEAAAASLNGLASKMPHIIALVGYPEKADDIYNAAAVIQDREVKGSYRKWYLPNYGVFDENRYFMPGREIVVLEVGQAVVGISICEDLWYPGGPLAYAVAQEGAQLLLNLSASPYHAGKGQERRQMIARRAIDNVAVVAYCNLVGGQDDLVFDGTSLICDESGVEIARGKSFAEDLVVADIDLEGVFRKRLHDPRRRMDLERLKRDGVVSKRIKLSHTKPEGAAISPELPDELAPDREIYQALTLGVGDYVRKNDFGKVVLGLSGGIDSALSAAIAVDALGSEQVVGVTMPSRFTSTGTYEDAKRLAGNLGIELMEFPIEGPFEAFKQALAPAFAEYGEDLTEENIQARIRGTLLMALSNKFGWLVLVTGNKSELAMGYCTLYGDTAGGFAVLKDVSKAIVYQLARFRNSLGEGEKIPRSIIDRAPSAELRADQRDEDSLPPYDVLDPILEAYIEEDQEIDKIIAQGYEPELVRNIVRTVDRNEYKRRQGPIGIKITTRAFGKDRRFPVTNRFR